MKNQLRAIGMAGILSCLVACNDRPAPKEEPGVKVEGNKGGEMKIDKDKLDIQGKKGGELKIDSNGVKVEKPTDKR